MALRGDVVDYPCAHGGEPIFIFGMWAFIDFSPPLWGLLEVTVWLEWERHDRT